MGTYDGMDVVSIISATSQNWTVAVLITNWIQYPTQTRTKVFIQVLKCKAQFSGYQQSTNQRN